LLSPGDELIDLNSDEAERVKAITRDWLARELIKSKPGAKPSEFNGRAIRAVRPASRGLLLIYALDEREAAGAESGTPIMALAVSFPRSEAPQSGAIDYLVNN